MHRFPGGSASQGSTDHAPTREAEVCLLLADAIGELRAVTRRIEAFIGPAETSLVLGRLALAAALRAGPDRTR